MPPDPIRRLGFVVKAAVEQRQAGAGGQGSRRPEILPCQCGPGVRKESGRTAHGGIALGILVAAPFALTLLYRFEAVHPVYEDLNGIQLSNNWWLNASISKGW